MAKAASHIREMLSGANGKLFLSPFSDSFIVYSPIYEPKAFKEANVTADRIKCI
jgi:hypothetical protein